MRNLLDVNVLVALFDERHVHNKLAHTWLTKHLKNGWASCPITENGLIRILANPNYSRFSRYAIEDIASRLIDFQNATNHEFWTDKISLLDREHFDTEDILGVKQLTDVYLLGIAAANKGRFVTFDRTVAKRAAIKANRSTLQLIGG